MRADIAAPPPPAERFTGRQPLLRLLVLGGSLGAAAINETVPKGLALIDVAERPQVVHQAGARHLDQLRRHYADAGVHADCVAFIDDMAGAYEWADLRHLPRRRAHRSRRTRAPASRASVPFPHAVDDHQTMNARFLASAGGAILLPQGDMTPESVSLLRNYTRGQLLQMAERARALAKPEAAAEVARVCEEVVK